MHEPARPLPVAGEPIQEIRSAEQVALRFPIAGPGTRVLAYAIDAMVLGLIECAVLIGLFLTTPLAQSILEAFRPLLDEGLGGRAQEMLVNAGMLVIALLIIGQLLVEWAYFMLSEWLTGGRSIGKRAVGLRVMGDDGLPLTSRASLVRNLLRAVDALPGSYVVGLVAIVASPRCQRLGDLAAGTIVVRLDAGAPLDLPIDGDSAGDAFRFSHAQVAALGPLERQLLRQTLRRVEALDGEPAAVAVERSVEALRGRMGYEPVAPGQRMEFLRALLRVIERG
ncbi:RDD family protein [bacterium]|nr:RDD family protein [bacterium]